MRCEDIQARLGDLAEGTLDGETRTATEAHLRDCPACAVLAADLARVRQLASTLDRLPPPTAAWPRIRERADPSGARRRVWTRSWSALALAACVLLAVALGVVLRRGEGPASEPAQAPAAAAPVPVAEHPELKTVAEELRLAEQHYENAITGLEKLANDREVLDPQVAAALQKNLQVIDLAISESRAALVKQPASEPAQQSLFEAFRTKIALLQDTIALINEMRKGNQAEAARIAEGLKKS
jgi:anti-sigma factor RsiW